VVFVEILILEVFLKDKPITEDANDNTV